MCWLGNVGWNWSCSVFLSHKCPCVCEVAVLGSGDQVESPLTLSLLSVFCRRSLEAGGR